MATFHAAKASAREYRKGRVKLAVSVHCSPPQPIDEFREIAGKGWYTPWYTITMFKTVLE